MAVHVAHDAAVGVVLLVWLSVCFGSPSVPPLGWGYEGHDITALLATSLLDKEPLDRCNSILGGESLEDVSTWADTVRSQSAYKWSAPLHYINTPDWACDYQPSRDCPDNMCVAGAVSNYTGRLGDSKLSAEQTAEALKFLVHFMGDIHQPMHVGFASNKGGNDIEGEFMGYKNNLHAVWDTWLLYYRIKQGFEGDMKTYVEYLLSKIRGDWKDIAKSWEQCDSGKLPCPAQYANEGAVLACTHAYTNENGKNVKNGFDLAQPYEEFNADVIDTRLAQGGVRLAAILNSVLSPAPSTATAARLQRLLSHGGV